MWSDEELAFTMAGWESEISDGMVTGARVEEG